MLSTLCMLCMLWARHTLCMLGLEDTLAPGEVSIMMAVVWHRGLLCMLW